MNSLTEEEQTTITEDGGSLFMVLNKYQSTIQISEGIM